MPLELTSDQLISLAAQVLEIESRAVESLRARLDENFVAACQLCLDTPGRIVVTGMGKSGHISGKIAATLAAEAVHLMEENRITSLLVTDDEKHLIGALNIHNLFRAGIM